MSNCIFCDIVNRKIPAEIVAENEHAIAFKDIQAVAPHHYLVIPKKHIENILGFEPKDAIILGCIFELISELTKSKGLNRSGFRVVTNTGEHGGQTVHHVHFHVIGGRQLDWPPG